MSGHNKWSKIKHKKASTDAQKSRMFSKHATLIAVESRKAKGDVSAPGLMAAIERAKKDSMPKDNIERAIQKGTGAGADTTEEVTYEAYGAGGAALVVVCLTDNRNRTGQEIKHIFSTHGTSLGAQGSALWGFQKTADGYEPATTIPLSPDDETKLSALIEELEEHDDVQDVYTNAA